MTDSDKVIIIAEAGVNHNGSLDMAYRLVDAAASAGADVVKFQTWKTERLVTRDAGKAAYQIKTTDGSESQFDMLKRLELPYDDFRKIKAYCDKRRIRFLSTADEIESAIFLNQLQDIFKVGSAELTDLPFLEKLARFGKPVILSTGMGDMGEISTAIDTLVRNGCPKAGIVVLHCTTEYPAPYEEVNLAAMRTIRDAFDVAVGYSDHTVGIEVSVAAVALGARVIEKHFTIDKKMKGPDHTASLEPDEFALMVRSIRNIERALGDGIKRPSRSELKNRLIVRKSIVASRNIDKGEPFTAENITVKRPGTGISPVKWHDVVGKIAGRAFKEDEAISI